MLAVLTCLFLFLHALAAAEGSRFNNPPPMENNHNYGGNEVYELGEMVQLRWSTDIKHFDILLWQNNNSNPETLMNNETSRTKYNWLASTQRQLSNGNVFFFHIANTDNHTEFFQSHYFNLTDPSSSSSSSSSSHGSGLSPQAKVGIGVGVGLGGAFFIAIAIIIWYFRRRLLRQSAAPAPTDNDNVGPTANPDTDIKELPYTTPPAQKVAEAPAETRVEAPAAEIRHELP